MMAITPSAVRDRIFISYRRNDARGASGRVWDWLRIGFGRERVFRDVGSIGVGRWRDKIEQALAVSAACVAVIGRRWSDRTNLPRLHDPGDMVRYELETALALAGRGELTVVPLLVEEAQLSEILVRALPDSLQPLLADWNVLELTETGWDEDTRRLIRMIAEATGLPVQADLDEWLALMAGAERGLTTARQGQPPADALTGEQQALETLLTKVAEAPTAERRGLKTAFEALEAGNTQLAEEAFEREVEASDRLIAAAAELVPSERRKQAEAATNVGSLAVVRGDLNKAVRFFEKALEAAPDDLSSAVKLGYAWMSLGSLPDADGIFGSVIVEAHELGKESLKRWGLNGRGDVLVARGDGPRALQAYQAGLEIAEALVEEDPADTQLQRDLSVSHNKIGDVLLVQGDGRGALQAYRASLEIRETVMQRHPTNIHYQCDLSVSHQRIGDVLLAQGDGPGALQAYWAGLEIAEALVEGNPADTKLQRDLLVSHTKIGDVLLAQGDGPGALQAYGAGLEIAEALVQRDPANADWQRDLSVSHTKIGQVLVAQGDGPGALQAYRAGREVRETLVQRDPANTQWQRDLSVSHTKIGELLVAQGDGPGALQAYRAGSEITEALVQRDPANTEWQHDLSVNHNKIGDVMMAQGDVPGALQAYRADLEITGALVRRDPANTQWQHDLSVSHQRIGDVLVALGDGPRALQAYRACLEITEALVQRDRANAQWQRSLSVSHTKIGDVMMALGDGAGALQAYRAGLEIAEALVQRDTANTQWQADLACSCGKMGSLESLLTIEDRRVHLLRGRRILAALKGAGSLHANQDGIRWFDRSLESLN